MNNVIAIDGGAGTGKSSTAKLLASRLHTKYLGTGLIYRAATYYCVLHEVPLEDEVSVYCAILQFVEEYQQGIGLKTDFDPDDVKFYYAGVEISSALRDLELTRKVQFVSSNLRARALLVKMQQDIVTEFHEQGIVLEGRDTTDVIAPDARVRVILTASSAVRAVRRAKDLGELNVSEIEKKLQERDAKDAEVTSFEAPNDAGIHVIDTSNLTISEVVDKIMLY
ncbi:MAG: (d)CMP kinase [Candidatus Ancillula sp.]|jgi:cytidylate kinase|nr:(d)CMP kinase [Candidatus Ancillula sp.]